MILRKIRFYSPRYQTKANSCKENNFEFSKTMFRDDERIRRVGQKKGTKHFRSIERRNERVRDEKKRTKKKEKRKRGEPEEIEIKLSNLSSVRFERTSC